MASSDKQMYSSSHCHCCGALVKDLCESSKDARNTSETDMYSLLMHVVPPRQVADHKFSKKFNKPPKESIYKETYCHLKTPTAVTKSCKPYDYRPPVEARFADETTNRSTHKLGNKKKLLDCRRQKVVMPCNVDFPKGKLQGKSETKVAFRNPNKKPLPSENNPRHKVEDHEETSNMIKIKPKPWPTYPFSSSTTYRTFFKRPKPFPKVIATAPDTKAMQFLYTPFRHITQYMSDFKGKKLPAREGQTQNPNNKIYRVIAPENSMENKTSYRTSYSADALHHHLKKDWYLGYSLKAARALSKTVMARDVLCRSCRAKMDNKPLSKCGSETNGNDCVPLPVGNSAGSPMALQQEKTGLDLESRSAIQVDSSSGVETGSAKSTSSACCAACMDTNRTDAVSPCNASKATSTCSDETRGVMLATEA